ncbi:hypothetical protein MAR_ORF343 [Marseillevirus marseillevirus]|uniref:Uncharacterized protein n=1 Tax=Marseillevirus marseillevirus TaxID=694581 RepID=D2XAY3_GBMV|nr:hypothetical protein MAR_ORF343 [Marseillevirus marseillevirus]ADB04110.1 hypothetical protein MAR_ORF343 [Marseillevirus marseillevirus]
MQQLDEIVIEQRDGVVHFFCIFCSKERKLREKTFQRKPFCASCAIRTIGYETVRESYDFLESEYENAREKLLEEGLTLLETKQTFATARKSLCFCECGKKHRALPSDFERAGYTPCPLKRSRRGQNATKEDKIRELFRSRGCEYIGPYINNKTLTKYLCFCGKEREVKVHAIKENWKGCRECSYKARAEAMRK